MSSNEIYYRYARKEMANFLPDKYTLVLEIGCAEGNFTDNFKQGVEIWGIELNSDAAEKAKKKMHCILIGKYDEVYNKLPNDYFNLVVCNDVIEHMEDHDFFFSSVRRKMKDNGYLVGSIPNVRYYYNLKSLLLKRDWKYTDAGILDRTHLRFFTDISIKRTLEKHAFSIERYEGINKLQLNSFSLESILNHAVIYSAIAMTLGSYNDIRYLQFGFRARKTSRSN